ncbi:MAG: acylphosphatase [Anaerolineaceae bacterium]|nr:acylphosphatase [Anaerolineaceae bacterium]
MDAENQRMHVIVNGIVQGVGFRFFVFQHGNLLKLRGWVRNCINGNVEVLAEGPRKELEYLLEKLKVGPEMAQVVEANVDWQPYKGNLPVFTVLPTDY